MARGDAKGATARRDRRLNHELIVKLGREGATAREVIRAHQQWAVSQLPKRDRVAAEMHGDEGLIPVSTVYSIWHREGVERRQATYTDLIPWVLRAEHRNTRPAQMLRALASKRAGNMPAESVQVKLDKFLRTLEKENSVWHYDPDDPRGRKGWMRTDRREGIDTDVIRSPWYTDKGERIVRPAGLRAGARAPWDDDEEPSVVIDLRGSSPVLDLRERSRSRV